MNSFEWLETDGLGGFAMGNSELIPERKYHSLLSSSNSNSGARQVLVQGVEIYLQTATQSIPLQGFRYKGGVVHPHPSLLAHDTRFTHKPCPSWTYNVPSIGKIEFSILMLRGESVSILNWQTDSSRMDLSLKIRPFLVCRDIHSLRREAHVLPGREEILNGAVLWAPFEGDIQVLGISSGKYNKEPLWYRDIYLREEEARGYEYLEDAYSPGEFILPLTNYGATLAFSPERVYAIEEINLKRQKELERRRSLSDLERASEHYLIKRQNHVAVIAGYPWFGEWGRDTFIALRGLALPFKKLSEVGEILSFWASQIKDGLVPNYLEEKTGWPHYNSVDASLWFILAVFEFIKASRAESVVSSHEEFIIKAVKSIIDATVAGTIHGIGMESDLLLKAGDPGVQLTWMDAKVGDKVVTPRRGKPVEVQALWINALMASAFLLSDSSLRSLAQRAQENFIRKFWSEQLGYFLDVIDCDGSSEKIDPSLRPNQLLALGGLPFRVVDDTTKVRRALSIIESKLLTPYGIRTLAVDDARYIGIYQGDQSKRDLAYHQGSAWPWLLGSFVDAWLYSRGYSAESKSEAKQRFLEPMLHVVLKRGMVPELCDGDPPYTFRGCPFQAWSLGEIIRILEVCEDK